MRKVSFDKRIIAMNGREYGMVAALEDEYRLLGYYMSELRDEELIEEIEELEKIRDGVYNDLDNLDNVARRFSDGYGYVDFSETADDGTANFDIDRDFGNEPSFDIDIQELIDHLKAWQVYLSLLN